jgi:hypothetical protein
MGVVISQVVIDSENPVELARWWAQALGWHVVWESSPDADEPEAAIAPDPDARTGGWLFERVPESKTVKNRLHYDLRPENGSSQEAELERLLGLGARRVDIGQGDVTWHVLADPEGNEFCVLRSTPDELDALLAAEATSG